MTFQYFRVSDRRSNTFAGKRMSERDIVAHTFLQSTQKPQTSQRMGVVGKKNIVGNNERAVGPFFLCVLSEISPWLTKLVTILS